MLAGEFSYARITGAVPDDLKFNVWVELLSCQPWQKGYTAVRWQAGWIVIATSISQG